MSTMPQSKNKISNVYKTSGNSNIVAKYLPLKKSSKKIVIEVYQEDPHLKLAPGWGLGSEG